MDLIIKLYKNNELVSEEAFDGRAFYNAIPVHFAMTLSLSSLMMTASNQHLNHLKKD